ncbi:MAG: hypothetical protein WCD46_15075 [Desulfobacterales bacterium]
MLGVLEVQRTLGLLEGLGAAHYFHGFGRDPFIRNLLAARGFDGESEPHREFLEIAALQARSHHFLGDLGGQTGLLEYGIEGERFHAFVEPDGRRGTQHLPDLFGRKSGGQQVGGARDGPGGHFVFASKSFDQLARRM